MNKPLVSVILCCYNQQAYVTQSMLSVLRQQCDFDFELIVGEDASTDHTAEVCREIQAAFPDKVVLICNEENKGVVRNYFDCIRASNGELIADCAGDDFWMGDDRLQHLVDAWRAHPSASIVYGNYADYHADGDTYTLHNSGLKEDRFDADAFGPATVARFLSRQIHPDIVLSTALYPKTLLFNYLDKYQELFIGPRYPAEDISVTSALLMQGPAYYVNEVNLAYRVLDETVSHSKDMAKNFRFGLKTFVQTIDWALFLNVDCREMKDWFRRHSAWYMQMAFSLGSKNGASEIREACRRTGQRLPWRTALKYAFLQLFGKTTTL